MFVLLIHVSKFIIKWRRALPFRYPAAEGRDALLPAGRELLDRGSERLCRSIFTGRRFERLRFAQGGRKTAVARTPLQLVPDLRKPLRILRRQYGSQSDYFRRQTIGETTDDFEHPRRGLAESIVVQ